MKNLSFIIAGLCFAGLFSVLLLNLDDTVGTTTAGGGSGTIQTLDQWKSDGTNITQRTASKPIKITGLTTGTCLTLDGSNILTTTSCGGSGATFPFVQATTYNTQFNATTSLFLTTGLYASSTSYLSALRVPAGSASDVPIGVNNDANTGIAGTATDQLDLIAGGTTLSIDANGVFFPGTTNVRDLGKTTNLWRALYASNASTSLVTTTGTAWILNASTTALSARTAAFGGTATSSFSAAGVLTLASALTVGNGGTGATTITGLVLGNGASAMTAYAGGSCTNQFLTALSAAGAFTCGSVNLANGTQVTGTLPIGNGGTGSTTVQSGRVMYGGSTAYQSVATGTVSAGTGITISATIYALLNAASIAVDQAANFAWTGVHDFGSAVIEITNGSSPTIDATGEFGLDTTSNYLLIGTSTNSGDVGVIPLFDDKTFTYSTSSTWTGTTTIYLGTALKDEYWKSITCYTDTGTLGVSAYDGTNRMTYIPTASTTNNKFLLSTNSIFTTGEKRMVDVGTPASSPRTISCTPERYLIRD